MPAIGDMPYLQLIRQLKEMRERLNTLPHNFDPEHTRDEFWYDQKISELKTLREQFEQASQRVIELRKLMDEHYLKTRKQYKYDLRWLDQRRKLSAHSLPVLPRVKQSMME